MRNLSSVLMNIDLLLTELKCHLPCAEANGNVRVFGESGFTHADLLRGNSQYAGRSLKENGPICRDAYKYAASSASPTPA